MYKAIVIVRGNEVLLVSDKELTVKRIAKLVAWITALEDKLRK